MEHIAPLLHVLTDKLVALLLTPENTMYEKAIADLENKAKRQREMLKTTEETIAGLKALNERDQLPLIKETANATTPSKPTR